MNCRERVLTAVTHEGPTMRSLHRELAQACRAGYTVDRGEVDLLKGRIA
jgi:DNA-binding IclR family transcriptional regulator